MANLKCDIINPNFEKLINVVKKWSSSDISTKQMKDPYAAALRMAKNEFGNTDIELLMYDPGEILTKGRLKAFESSLNELNKGIARGSLGGGPSAGFSEYFWQSSRYGAKDPIIGKYLRDMQNASFYFRKNELRDRSRFQVILDFLKKDAGVNSLSERYTYNRAQKRLKELDDDLVKALNDNNSEKVSEINSQINKLTKDGELKSFGDLMHIVEKGMKDASVAKYNILKEEAVKYEKGNKRYKKSYDLISKVDKGERVIRLTKNEIGELIKDREGNSLKFRPEMYKAVVEYDTMMEDLYGTLRNGTDKVIDIIIKRNKLNGSEDDVKSLTEMKERLRKELMPKYEQGFFPHYVRDLSAPFMQKISPLLDDLQEASNPYLKDKNQTVSQIVNKINTEISKHAKGRAGENSYSYSKNFLSVVSSYISDVNRFNFTSFVNSNFIDSISGIEKIYKKEGTSKEYAENLVSYMQDLQMAANGNNQTGRTSRAVQRTLLGFEFISKLGINPRSAARNFTQRLLDYVEWGPAMIAQSNNTLRNVSLTKDGKSIDSELYIEGALRDAGLLFDEVSPQLIESGLQGPASMFNLRKWNETTGKYEILDKTKLEQFADGTSWLAAKSSVIHRMAENSNRKHTFKIAFAQMYRWMKDNPLYASQKRKEWGENFSESRLEESIQKLASNYAKNMVVTNHFDYADYAKSKLMRSDIGRFMFQFQHYSMEFFERNLKIYREAKGDVLAGRLLPGGDARGLAKAYRLGIAYFLAPVIASAVTGVNFENLVEHDSANRINQLKTLLTGDDEEIKKAFYGKGPILSTFGGPLASDLIDIGIMYDLINLDEDSLLTILTGMQEYDLSTQSTDLTKKIRILNTFLGRTVERHIPQLNDSRIGWSIQQELGLYPTKEAKEKQKIYKKARKKILPDSVEDALTRLEEGQLG